MARCPLYKICKSSGKKKSGWVCTKGDDKTRKQSCAVFVGYYAKKDMGAVLDLEQKDVTVKSLNG